MARKATGTKERRKTEYLIWPPNHPPTYPILHLINNLIRLKRQVGGDAELVEMIKAINALNDTHGREFVLLLAEALKGYR